MPTEQMPRKDARTQGGLPQTHARSVMKLPRSRPWASTICRRFAVGDDAYIRSVQEQMPHKGASDASKSTADPCPVRHEAVEI
jgi:hypothetical protein